MRSDELKAAFDQQASRYDKQWAKLAPIRDGLHFLLESVFAELPIGARVLCVGVGTGAELAHLASKFPHWMWLKMMAAADVSPEARERTLAAWEKDVAILPPAEVACIIESGGFEAPVQFFQAGLIHAWFSRRAPEIGA